MIEPSSNWPWAPMLNSPALRATITASPVRTSGVAFSSVSTQRVAAAHGAASTAPRPLSGALALQQQQHGTEHERNQHRSNGQERVLSP